MWGRGCADLHRGSHGDRGKPAGIRLASGSSGKLHNLSAIPIFAGLPIAALASAFGAARRGDVCWAGYSAGSGVAMVASFVAFGAAFGPESRLSGEGGIFQRISIASGFGWLTVLSLRVLSSLRGPSSTMEDRTIDITS